jgi:hypothetical protein
MIKRSWVSVDVDVRYMMHDLNIDEKTKDFNYKKVTDVLAGIEVMNLHWLLNPLLFRIFEKLG